MPTLPHESVLAARERRFAALDEELDVLVIGGGISGAPLYHELCRRGYRTAIIDRSDFASGTSQAS
ncbi:MAG: FAD-dependent oxidoreductase, partial [Akkermansiaceae bacterium]|nr:FAD-dependent oxidoreductase [Akkermansiaceae bacterium]